MIRFLLLAAGLSATLVSCAKASDPEPSPTPTPTPTPTDDSTRITVTAPTLSDGTSLQWKKGDLIAVCDQAKNAPVYLMRASEDGNSVVFKSKLPTTMTAFKAFAPGDAFLTSTSVTNLRFSSPEARTADSGISSTDNMPMVAMGDNVADGFTMTPVAASLRFRIAGSDIIGVKLSVGSSSSDYVAADIVTVNCSTLNTSATDATASIISNSITLTPSSGTSFAPGDYCIGILSKSSRRTFNGYSLIYSKTDGSTVTRKSSDLLYVTSGAVIQIEGDETTVTYTSSAVSGKVMDKSTGKGIAGVPVSDGIQLVKTSSDGSYSFTSDLTRAQNVFVIMPSEYEFSFNEYGGWNDHVLLDSHKNRQTVDFALTPRSSSADKYRILLLGDPQQMSSRPHSIESWTYVCEGINEYRTSVSVPLYQISLGDMVTNEIEVEGMAEAYLSTQKKSGVGTFSVPGNHDHVQKAATYYASVSEFSRWFGPYNYAFNLGSQHFVFLDSCDWDNGNYTCGLNEQAINFLEMDLALVDSSVPVHIFTHCPLTKKQNGGFPSTNKYHTRMMQALSGRCVNIWYGHIHINVNYSYTAEELSSKASGVKSLGSHIVARCGGCWECSGEVCHDGSPRGFVELDIDGTSSRWQYHSLDEKYPQVFNTCLPGQFAGEGLTKVDDSALYCNVYMWDNSCPAPEVWVEGRKEADMTRVKTSTDASYDPMYQHFYPIWKASGQIIAYDNPPGAGDNMHLFKYVPASSLKAVEIRSEDSFGRTTKRKLSW